MKVFKIVVIWTLFMSISCAQSTRSADKNAQASHNRVEVIDFYGTHRCRTCKAIEANAKYTVEQLLPEAYKSGKLVFKTVNVDKEENYDMAEKYEAVGTALFLNVVKEGKEKHIDLTDFAFLKGTDKDAFSRALKKKIEAQLKAL